MKSYTAAYMRVSKSNGVQSTQSQELALKTYIKQQNLTRVKWFEDQGTGRNTKREKLNEIIEDCKAGRCNRLILWKLDRLSRSCRDTLNLISDLMQKNVTIVVTSQNLTLDNSAMSKAIVQLFGLIAELESNFISERVRAGLAVAREKGTRLGRKTNEQKRAKLKRWFEQGLSVEEQAKKLGCSSVAIYRMRKRMQLA